MPGFGEKLRSEREARHVTIEKIADETGIQRGYLEALEENAFGTLPGRSFGKLYIRSYARMLGIDPQPLIEEYDRELQRARQVPTPSPDAGPASSRPVGSMISSWRQERIAERRRPTTGVDDGEFAAAAGEAGETAPDMDDGESMVATGEAEKIATNAGEPAAAAGETEETGLPDESAASDASVISDDVVTEQESGPNEAAPDLAARSTPARKIRSKTLAVGALTLGLLVVVTVFAILTIRQGRSEDPGLAPADPAGRSSQSVAAAAAPKVPASAAPSAAPSAKPSEPSSAAPGMEPSVAMPPPRNSVPEAPSSDSLPEPRRGGTDLSVTESALGRRVADRRVVDLDDRFAEGTEVWFQTRVLGGEPGDAVRHVWIHDGRAVQSIRLPLGRSDWRTMSRKTVRHVGPWAVEARDEAGRVLARAVFTCERSTP